MSAMTVVTVSSDLIFRSKIGEVAAASGAEHVSVRSQEKLIEALSLGGEKVVLVDLNTASIDSAGLYPLIAGSEGVRRIVAFVSHVDEDAIVRARDAGYTEIMPRSKFVQVLPALLSRSSS